LREGAFPETHTRTHTNHQVLFMRPLEGITILDLTRLLPGPYGTMLLGTWEPRSSRSKSPSRGLRALVSSQINPGRSPASSAEPEQEERHSQPEEARRAVHSMKMVESGADVLIEQFRPGVMDRLGVGYKTCKRPTRVGLLFFDGVRPGRTLPRYRRP